MAGLKGLDQEAWQAKLSLLGRALGKRRKKMRLEVIGAWPLIEAGMPSRATMDIDIWDPEPALDLGALRSACVAAEIDFDPKGEVTGPYLQIVRPGIVQVPEHTPVALQSWGGLTLVTPPPAALAAAKLTRAEMQDIADILFLRTKYGLTPDDVAAYVERIPHHRQREMARENLVYLEAQG